MHIDKAIEILRHYKNEGEAPCPPALDDALKLGIEALIFTQNVLKLMPIVFPLPLPGETTD